MTLRWPFDVVDPLNPILHALLHFNAHFEPDLLQALLPPVLDAVVFALAPNTLGLPSLLNLLVAVSRNRVGLRLHVLNPRTT